MTRDEVNILKGVAIFGVVGLHLLSVLPWLALYHGLAFQTSVVADMFLRFSVPMFVALSGYALSAKYLNQKINLREFYINRVLKLLPLYLFWTIVIYLVVNLYKPWSGFVSSSDLWQIIFLGRGDYHLYFVPMIFQLYLLFPILRWLVNKWGAVSVYSAFVFQVYIYNYYFSSGLSDQVRYFWFFSWLFYFILGVFLAGKKLKKFEVLTRIVMLISFGLVIFEAWRQILMGKNIIDVTTFTTIPILIFATSFVILATQWANEISGLSLRVFKWCGVHSYVIYLGHTLVLRILFGLGHDPLGMVLPSIIVLIAFFLTRLFG